MAGRQAAGCTWRPIRLSTHEARKLPINLEQKIFYKSQPNSSTHLQHIYTSRQAAPSHHQSTKPLYCCNNEELCSWLEVYSHPLFLSLGFFYATPRGFQGSREKLQADIRDEVQVTNTTVRCFVDAGLIITFPSNMSDQLRQDMLCSLLIGQITADQRYSRHTQLEQWVDYFNDVLRNIAWGIQKQSPTDLQTKDSKFRHWSRMAGDVNTSKKVFSTYNALPSDDSTVKAFTNSAYDEETHDHGSFSPCRWPG